MLVYQAQVRLVDKRGGLQRVSGTFARKLARGNPLQLEIDDRQQFVERRSVARLRLSEQSCYAIYQNFTLLS